MDVKRFIKIGIASEGGYPRGMVCSFLWDLEVLGRPAESGRGTVRNVCIRQIGRRNKDTVRGR